MFRQAAHARLYFGRVKAAKSRLPHDCGSQFQLQIGVGLTVNSAAAVMFLPPNSGDERVLHLLCWAKTELARRCDLDCLARAGIAALACRALFDFELAKARKADLFAFLGGLENSGKNRFDRLPGRARVHTRCGRYLINQFGSLQFGLP